MYKVQKINKFIFFAEIYKANYFFGEKGTLPHQLGLLPKSI